MKEKPKEYIETYMIHFDTCGDLSQSEENKYMWTHCKEITM